MTDRLSPATSSDACVSLLPSPYVKKADSWFGRLVNYAVEKSDDFLELIESSFKAALVQLKIVRPVIRFGASPLLMTTVRCEGGTYTWKMQDSNFSVFACYEIINYAVRKDKPLSLLVECVYKLNPNIVFIVQPDDRDSFKDLGFQPVGRDGPMYLDSWAKGIWAKVIDDANSEQKSQLIASLKQRPVEQQATDEVKTVKHEHYTLQYKFDPLKRHLEILKIERTLKSPLYYMALAIEFVYQESVERGIKGQIVVELPMAEMAEELEWLKWGFAIEETADDAQMRDFMESEMRMLEELIKVQNAGSESSGDMEMPSEVGLVQLQQQMEQAKVPCRLHQDTFNMWDGILKATELSAKQQGYAELCHWHERIMREKEEKMKKAMGEFACMLGTGGDRSNSTSFLSNMLASEVEQSPQPEFRDLPHKDL